MPKTEYLLLFVCGTSVTERRQTGAPKMQRLVAVAKSLGAHHVIRYWPKYGGWRVTHTASAFQRPTSKGFNLWVNHHTYERVYPSADSALMAVMHLLGEKIDA